MRNNSLPRGLRNNNPGNIRRNSDVFQGEKTSSDKEFKQFKSMAYGYRAIFKILSNYYRNYKLDPQDDRKMGPTEREPYGKVHPICI